MPFELRNAHAGFQTLMEKVLKYCSSFALVYLDVLINSNTKQDHLVHTRKVLAALRAISLTAKPAKCQWGRKQLEYLEHQVGCGNIAVPQHQVEDIAQYRLPSTKNDLRTFLGSIGCNRRFIQDFAKHSALLTPATVCTGKSRVDKGDVGSLSCVA